MHLTIHQYIVSCVGDYNGLLISLPQSKMSTHPAYPNLNPNMDRVSLCVFPLDQRGQRGTSPDDLSHVQRHHS